MMRLRTLYRAVGSRWPRPSMAVGRAVAWQAAVLLGAVALMGLPVESTAQLADPQDVPIVGARRPALSPDGTILAFVYRGDIWTVHTSGRRAQRLTDHVELDTNPIFSPDGRWIAFSSMRNGNWDIFAIPALGGSTVQLTFSGWGELASDWSPNSREILFAGNRDRPDSTLFALDVRTLRFRPLVSDYRGISYPAWSLDGKQVAYQQHGFSWVRPRYAGSAAAQVWTVDLATGKRNRVTQDDRQHLWPRYLRDGRILCVATGELTPSTTRLGEKMPRIVDSPLRTPNLWAFDASGRGQQLTRFVGGSVRWPCVAFETGDIAFEYGDGIWLLRANATEPVKLTMCAPSDDKENNLRRETLTSGVTEAEVSHDGKTIAFAVRGDMWTVPVEKPKKRNPDDATRLTDYPGWDGDFVWTRDGKKLFFTSDRGSSLGLYELDLETKAVKARWTGDGDAINPQLSPDGKLVGFWVSGSEGGLYTIPVEGGQATRRIHLPGTGTWGSGGREFSFSPDMEWLAYTRRAERGTLNVWITPTKGGLGTNVTRLNAYHSQPRWSLDGRYLYFQSDREGGGLYVLPLRKEDARSDELELKFTAPDPKTPVKVDIDFEDIELRIRRLATQNPDRDLAVGPDGTLYFLSGGDAWSVSYDGKETKRLTSGGGFEILRLQADGKKLLLVKSGGLHMLTLGPNNPVSPVTFSADWERDIRLERKAAFTQFWRNYNRNFYDDSFHGRDWAAIRQRYEPLLEGVGTRDEMATVLSMMVGELEASHTEVGPAPGPPSPTTPQLGFLFDHSHAGPGIRILEVPEGAPGSYPKTKLNAGEYVLAVNGKDVRLDETLFRILNDLNGKDLELLVNKEPRKEGARKVTYRALSGGEWGEIHYRNRIRRLRREVERRSGGRVAYVHLRGMGGGDQTHFEREFYEQTIGKDAAIVDVRFNGGGNIADTLTTWLAVKPYGYYRARDSIVEDVPSRSWDRPMVVLINENSMSNAEMFPYDMKQTGLATLIGMPTPGYVIWTGGLPLLDGTSARMPGSGVWRRDGTPLENNGQQPDIAVPMTAEDWEARRDPQLDAAINHLIQKLPTRGGGEAGAR